MLYEEGNVPPSLEINLEKLPNVHSLSLITFPGVLEINTSYMCLKR